MTYGKQRKKYHEDASMDESLKKLWSIIKNYCPDNEQEKEDRERMLMALNAASKEILFRAEPYHFTVSAMIFNETKDKILFAFHRIYQSWAWLGGHLDGDEDPLFAIKREIQEECGLTALQIYGSSISSLEILPVLDHMKQDKVVPAHQHFNVTYLFIGNEKDMIRPKLDENKAVAWIPLSQLEKKVKEQHMLPIYHKIIKKALKNE